MKEQLRRIYDDLSNGRISRQEALAKIRATKLQDQSAGAEPALLVPAWREGAWNADESAYAEHHIVLCDVAVDAEAFMPGARCMALQAREGESLAQRYTDYAAASFVRIQSILQDKSAARVLVQIVVTDERLAGLSGFLKTAALENPRIAGQVVIVPAEIGADALARILEEEKSRGSDALVQYANGVRQVRHWEEAPADAQPAPVAFKDGGVYLITGGLGALGVLFAREILAHTRGARIVLTGRSPLTPEKQALASSLSADYRQLDLGDIEQVRRLIAAIRDQYGQLDGVLHSAGMTADNFILRKSVAELRDVLAPKVAGTLHLDVATADVPLDFFVLFSSFAGAMGNAGQADYAAANAFLDQFAMMRNRQVASGERSGRTRSINWPLWRDGGMDLDDAGRAFLAKTTGARPMHTAAGMRAFHRALALPYDQLLVAEGDLTRIRAALAGEPPQTIERPAEPPAAIRVENLFEKTEEFLRGDLAGVLKMAPQSVDPEAPLEKYGIDSILAMKLTSRLEQTFGTLSRTLFFEYQTIRELAGYFVEAHAARLATLFTPGESQTVAEEIAETSAPATRRTRRVRAAAPAPAPAPSQEPEMIAIVGLSGRYPEAVDVAAYWQNLRDGRDCIIEVPKDRWDWKAYYSEDRTQSGHHYSKWGGFISGVDEFDPLFFNISPKEAKQMDPQERLFLQHAWMAIEDAGYTRAGLQAASDGDLAGQVGVYAGVMYNEYQLFGVESTVRGHRLGIAGSAASIANRVSYAFNLHGPSITLDTMCSSSLTAIHYACQDLKLGRTNLAIAGGVNVTIHPNKYLALSAGQFISSDGHCQSFGEGGDGYIPGEGVGVVVLKRLADAKRDGDHIYAVIRGTALNHGGKTNGYTVPNPQAQAAAIGRALAESNTDARHISYIEAHGTGTKLGDPIEIAALGKAFAAYTRDKGFCLIGSAKSNVGHCESAAGIAGLTKVLLQMQHRQIVPSLHSAQLNPHIDFDTTPFVVNQSLRDWEQPVIDGRTLPRIAGISSFGAGGSNAHVIVEEYVEPVAQPAVMEPVAIVLSARTAEQLRQKAQDLLAFVRGHELDLAAIAFTLQTGREPMGERLGFIASSKAELIARLEAFLQGANAGAAAEDEILANLLAQWRSGAAVDWSALHVGQHPRRVSLPTYPFARERYWIDIPATPIATTATAAVLHPLLHSNTSDLQQQSYRTTLRADEVSAAIYPEMARAAVARASAYDGVLEIRDLVWVQPPAGGETITIDVALFTGDAGAIEFEIFSEDVVLCQGRAVHSDAAIGARVEGERVPLDAIDGFTPDCMLHPATAAAALELCARAIGGVPSAMESLRVLAPCTPRMAAYVRNGDVDLCDEQGNVCAQLRGVSGQRIAASEPKEIVLTAAPVEKKQSGAIALAVPAGVATHSTTAARPRIALAKIGAAAAPAASSVRLFDDGAGVFSIHAQSSVADLRLALDRARQEPTLRVLLLHGLDSIAQYDQQLAREIVSFPYPVVAVLRNGATSGAFVHVALCDFMVCSEEAQYGFALAATPDAAALFTARFDEPHAHELLYVTTTTTGRELRAKGWSCPIVPAAHVDTHAKELASALAAKSHDALRLLKDHLTRDLSAIVDRLPFIGERAMASGDVRVLTLGKDQLDDLGGCKAAVLVIEDQQLSDAAALDVQRIVNASPVPVIAALPGDAKGNAWLASLFCDATVHSTRGTYSTDGAATHAAAVVFARRFGNAAAREVLLTHDDFRAADLQRRIGALAIADDAIAAAIQLAQSWPASTRSRVDDLGIAIEADELPVAHALPLHSRVVSVTAHPGGIAVVRMEDRDAKNMFSDALQEGMAEAFAHIDASPEYKVVVLTGYDSYFASGGTKESLLAIQAGKIKFTDSTMFRLPLDCRLPVIAAMQGHGIGAGWSLGMFADIALMSEESRYVSPYMEYGFTPGAGATWSLAAKLGRDLAHESLFTAQPVTGRALADRGALLRVLPRNEVLSAAMALAERIARAPRPRLVALKRQLTASAKEALAETLRREVAMHEQTFVGRADTLAQIESSFHQEAERAPVAAPETTQTADGDVLAAVMSTMRTLLANELQMRESDVDDNMQFIDMGLDSIGGVTWIRKINEKYQTAIEATKIYSHPTLVELGRLVKAEAEKAGTLAAAPAPAPTPTTTTPVTKSAAVKPAANVVLTPRRQRAARFVASAPAPAAAPAARRPEAIAIIGMAGQFPQARNVDEFWRNLAEGRDCITQVGRERWDLDAYYQPGDIVAGKTNCAWLGALEEYDRFDPLFFNISPTEALTMDPQQRLFLQACWHSIEDAGYDARALSGSKCGVFAGCATGDYHQLSRAHQLTAHGFTGSATSVLAARISYFLNLQGPCVSIDTACSSSLVAIAQACDSLTSGVSDLALAGGVYVMSGPEMHIKTAQAAMLSPEGRCFTFDQRADGFVPGEGVGVVVLKRLADAERDGDVIYGLIEGWGVNQDGKTNGITAPNPESQTRLQQEIYDRYAIDPTNIQLIEAHGTGTKLGDPIEVEGLKAAFAKYTSNREYCALGSVKSNIGHTLTAAGVAGVIKLLLALKHKQLPPTIHFEKLNEHIDLGNSPFYVNTRLQEWKLNGAPKRQAAISSFGFSGTNAHLVIGEWPVRSEVARPQPAKAIVPLSARTPEQLREKAQDLLGSLRSSDAGIAAVAFTLQTGRVPMDERLAFVVTSTAQLVDKLQAWLDGNSGDDVYQGQVRRNRDTLALFSDPDLQQAVDKWLVQQKLARLADLWVKGVELDWNKLHGDVKPRRIALPVYPFAKERYWIDAAPVTAGVATAHAALHPLLHRNASDLSGQRYRSTFDAAQTLTPVALLEMARAAVEHAVPERSQSAMLELHDVVWGPRAAVDAGADVTIELTSTGSEIEFEIFSGEVVYCQGSAAFREEPAPQPLDPAQPHVRVPASAEYVLHPQLFDGLIDGARTPVALESLRVFAPCAAETFAVVHTTDNTLTIDLCDANGNVCAQFRGLTLGAITENENIGRLLAYPSWQASEGETDGVQYAETYVIHCLDADVHTDVAARYREHALASFARVQDILEHKAKGRILVQLAVDDVRLAGLAGLLKTAALENPQFSGQLVVVPPQASRDEVERLLETERQRAADTVVRHDTGVRQVLRWEEVVEPESEPPAAFRDGGVYLITGGFGGLGVLFVDEILGRTRGAHVVLAGRSPLDADKQSRLDRWSGRVSYMQADVTDRDQAVQLVAAIQHEHARLDGILHCAGVLVENAIAGKSSVEFDRVLAPKVAAAVNLDEAARDAVLDFFVLFSSLAGVTGNRRTADYAVANAFLDQFAVHRNALVDAGQRHGRTRAINWPVWQDGGMGTDAASQERLEQATGMRPMRTATGMHAFHRSLALPHDQLLVVEGVPSAIRASYLQKPRVSAPVVATQRTRAARTSIDQLQLRLKQILAAVVSIDASEIDLDRAFMELGLDSFLGATLVTNVNKEFGTALSQLQVFDYPSIRELAAYVEQHMTVAELEAPAAIVPSTASAPRIALKKKIRGRGTTSPNAPADPRIAIIGMSGRYPGAENLRQYWDNLVHGRDSVGEVPPTRWDALRDYDPHATRPGTSSSKWLGAVDGVDCFDPLFFRISPQEADYIDPHHRLFLQESYRAIEDAGYAGSSLANRKCGVYLGINSSEYAQLLARHNALGASPVTSNHTAIAAARIAYYLNLKGPAISVDTACSSSLVAMHLACQGLASGETDMALAGGVTVWLTPESFASMTQAGMLAADGRCKAFDDSADGIVVGDGVGAVVLKRLADAEADGDFIYGVILGSGVNQDGKTNGITAPSIGSQIELERSVYARHGIHPDSITYVETHGTGTSLGDPIELEALSTVFKEQTERRNYCGLGSVKSNIGHTTSAAGVASVHKVLLSLQHRTLPPTLHVTKETSRFDFRNSPFYLVRETRSWDAADDAPRRAAVSSFGFSGTNAHLVIEEYRAAVETPVRPAAPVIVPLSARTPEQLREKSRDLLELLRETRGIDLTAIAYTLQTGRDAMEERLGIVAQSLDELEQKLAAFVDGARNIDGVHRGRVESSDDGMTVIGRDDDMQEAIDKWIARGKQGRLVELWVRGLSFDWNRLHDGPKPRRISLPGYPFARERHWIDQLPAAAASYPQRIVSTVDADSIDDIIDRIGDDLIDTDEAVTALKMLV